MNPAAWEMPCSGREKSKLVSQTCVRVMYCTQIQSIWMDLVSIAGSRNSFYWQVLTFSRQVRQDILQSRSSQQLEIKSCLTSRPNADFCLHFETNLAIFRLEKNKMDKKTPKVGTRVKAKHDIKKKQTKTYIKNSKKTKNEMLNYMLHKKW